MAYRCLIAIALFLSIGAVAHGQQGFTVATCFSEIPGSSCSPIEISSSHSLTLQGPVPQSSPHTAELVSSEYYYYQFHDVAPGNYILRTDGCNPFGCWLDTVISVVDRDVEVRVLQIGAETPTSIETPMATVTPTPGCLCDGNGDGRVTIDELVRAVGYALTGCPMEHCTPGMSCTVIGIDGLPLIGVCVGPLPPGEQTYICNAPDPGPTRTPTLAG